MRSKEHSTLSAILPIAILTMVLISGVPLPTVEEGSVTIAPSSDHQWDLDLASNGRLVFIIDLTSGGPISVLLLDAGNYSLWSQGKDFTPLPISENSVSRYHQEIKLEKGSYHLIITNEDSATSGEVHYRVYIDYDMLGNLTAKMVLALLMTATLLLISITLHISRRK